MNESNFKRAAEIIWNCWEEGEVIKNLPIDLQPKSRTEAYNIQQYYEEFSKKGILGWKIAATSLAGQKHIGVSGPLAGRLLQEKVLNKDDFLKIGSNRMSVAEPEFAFKMSTALKPKTKKYSQDEVVNSVESLFSAIELPDSRFLKFNQAGEFNLIADNACAHAFILGTKMPEIWRTLDLSKHSVNISVESRDINYGIGSNVMGDPRLALTWLVNELSKNNITLNSGSIVSTGTLSTPIPFKTGDIVKADYGILGNFKVKFL